MKADPLVARRKIGVCGSSKELKPDALRFCEALGERLGARAEVRIVSGGTKTRRDVQPGDCAAEWWIVGAAVKAMPRAAIFDRVVTVVREDDPDSASFKIGLEQHPRGKTGEARRIAFVRQVDALIAVSGGGGTDQELALAFEHDIRVLPVPLFGGAAAKYWKLYRDELMADLRIDSRTASRWERAPASSAGVTKLAGEMVDCLLRSLPRRCFVIMPYHESYDGLYDFIIKPAIEAAGDEAIRVDRAGQPGDVTRQIAEGIKHCEYAVAVLDDLRHNVIYELGMAHGHGKSTILVNRKGALGSGGAPFDISTQQRLEYSAMDAQLPPRLTRLIKKIKGGRH